jgi:hypothetical protein
MSGPAELTPGTAVITCSPTARQEEGQRQKLTEKHDRKARPEEQAPASFFHAAYNALRSKLRHCGFEVILLRG